MGMDEVPQTGSGKVKKHVLRSLGERIVAELEERKESGQSRDGGASSDAGAGFDYNGMEVYEAGSLSGSGRSRRRSETRRAETLFEYVFDENML